MVIDLLFLIFLVLGIFNGYSKGLIVGIFSLVALLAGLMVALKFSEVCTRYAGGHFHLTGSWWPVVFFILLFILVVWLVKLGARLITKLLELALLGWLNRLCGILLYICIYIVIFSILIWLANQVHLIPAEIKSSSRVYSWVAPVGPDIISFIGDRIPHFRHLLNNLADAFERMTRRTH